MAVTESSLLSSFLLPPAPLAVSLSLQQFTELFPKSKQSDPTIAGLYRELQQQRAQDIERVKQNIASEVRRGEAQQRQIRRIRQARQKQEHGEDGVELQMEAKLFPGSTAEQHREPHTVETLSPAMEQACGVLEEEIADIKKEVQKVLKEITGTVGDLSDLQYGSFSKMPGAHGGDLSNEVIDGLQRFQQLCNDTRNE